jgi:hypothetical protein
MSTQIEYRNSSAARSWKTQEEEEYELKMFVKMAGEESLASIRDEIVNQGATQRLQEESIQSDMLREAFSKIKMLEALCEKQKKIIEDLTEGLEAMTELVVESKGWETLNNI